MTIAYIARGHRETTTIRELTCPRGHSNKDIDWSQADLGNIDLPCEFDHYGSTSLSIEKPKDITTAIDRHLYEQFGFGTYTTLGFCRECSSHFWWVRYDASLKDHCRCAECEIKRLTKGVQPIDETIFQIMPFTSRRAVAGVPLFGKLTQAQQEKVNALPDLPIIIRRLKPVRLELKSIDSQIEQMSACMVEEGVPF